MKKMVVRILMLAAMIIATVGAVLIWSNAMTVSGWIAFGSLLAAEILLFVPCPRGNSRNFPLFLPLYLFVLPGYLIAALVLLVCSARIPWRIMASAQLGIVLFVMLCCGIALLISRPEGGNK